MFVVVVEERNIDPMWRRPAENGGGLVTRITLDWTEGYAFAGHRKQVTIVVDGVRQFTSQGIICEAAAIQNHAATDDCRQEAALAFGQTARSLVGIFS